MCKITAIIEKKFPYSLQPTTRITPSEAGASSRNDASRTAYNRLIECLRLNGPAFEGHDEIIDAGSFRNFDWKWPKLNSKRCAADLSLSESSNSKSPQESTSLETLSFLRIADSFDSKECSKEDTEADSKEDSTKEPFKENDSYEPLLNYLKIHDQTMYCANVANGKQLESKRLFDQDIYSLRSKAGASARDEGETILLRFQVSGATDLVVLNSAVSGRIGRHNVKFAIEVKTPTSLSSCKDQGPLREATVQLIGLNADNLNNAPPVLLTNLSNYHVVLHLVISSENPLKFNIIAQKCCNLPSALTLALKLSTFPALGRNFSRAPTPVFDHQGTVPTCISLCYRLVYILFYIFHVLLFY